jgi:tetratricopeptide (TPR) repeat protein
LSYLARSYAESQQEAETAISIDNKIATAHLNRGGALLYQDRYSEALEEFRESIWLSSREKVAYHNLGVLLDTHGEEQLAIDQLNKAIQIDPNYSSAHRYLGDIFLRKMISLGQSTNTAKLSRAILKTPMPSLVSATLCLSK